MGADSKIEWTDHSWNPWSGCQAVSQACDHCYAEALARRAPNTFGGWGPHAPRRRTSEAYWRQPLRWNRHAAAMQSAWQAGVTEVGQGNEAALIERGFIKPRRPRVFTASMGDIMDNQAPIAWLADAFDVMRITPQLVWLLLTKRPELIMRRLAAAMANAKARGLAALDEWITAWINGAPPENVWLGTTVENQAEADRRIPHLLSVPAAKRFLSSEPLLGPVDLRNWIGVHPTIGASGYTGFDGLRRCDISGGVIDGLDWIIAGGESGAHARPSHPEWFRALRDQCRAAEVAFFMKQMGGARKPFPPIPEDLLIREIPNG